MWRRLYLILVLLRLYFALSPSYIHPDEHFQGPEVISGEVFGWPTHRTWEFTSSRPIRSVFPLWLIYGIPLTILKWICEGFGYEPVPIRVAFYVLRTMMFTLSFVLEDWAIYELITTPRDRRIAILLIASSYVTWTYQTHTFSNSIETLIVLWCLVLIHRIRDDSRHTQVTACAVLAFLGVLGVFNRITFPAFLVIPAIQLAPHLIRQPLRVFTILITGLLVLAYAVILDTTFYGEGIIHIRDLPRTAIFTPLNNLLYNMDPGNLAQHGLHPFWQHFAANLPQLIGPVIPLIIFSSRGDIVFWSAIVGIALLSCFQHQEARFLLPAIPLLLSSVNIPKRAARLWVGSWVAFNMAAGILFGVYHQGGIVPAQMWIAEQPDVTQVMWWKTYSPPHWLLDGRIAQIETTDLMGISGEEMLDQLTQVMPCDQRSDIGRTLLVAPASAVFIDHLLGAQASIHSIHLNELWRYRRHIGLDDLDFGDDGVLPTLQRVVGRRGLVVYQVDRSC